MSTPDWVDQKAKQLNRPKGAANEKDVQPAGTKKRKKRTKKSKTGASVPKETGDSAGG